MKNTDEKFKSSKEEIKKTYKKFKYATIEKNYGYYCAW